jgi:hypothetical protein
MQHSPPEDPYSFQLQTAEKAPLLQPPRSRSSSKLRKASALPPTMKPNEKKVEDRKVPKAAAKTNSDSVAGGQQPDETARVNF